MKQREPQPIYPTLKVSALLQDDAKTLALNLVAGKDGLEKEIKTPQTQKPGLVLAGYKTYLKQDRIQVLGGSEIQYIEELTPKERISALEPIFAPSVPCIIGTRNLPAPDEIIFLANKRSIALFTTHHQSSVLIYHLTNYLEEKLAPYISLHGEMLEIFGVGVLILGDPGIGKSECALTLVARGQYLIGDDSVYVKRREGGILIAEGKDLIHHHMEIRGMGIIDIRELFGSVAIKPKKEINLIVQLESWEEEKDYERLGLEYETSKIMEANVPTVKIPVVPGRNLAVLIEVAARNYILRLQGKNPAKALDEKQQNAIFSARKD